MMSPEICEIKSMFTMHDQRSKSDVNRQNVKKNCAFLVVRQHWSVTLTRMYLDVFNLFCQLHAMMLTPMYFLVQQAIECLVVSWLPFPLSVADTHSLSSLSGCIIFSFADVDTYRCILRSS